jgi:hypothetical protein
LPEKWLENISLRDIVVTNAGEGARITRVKSLTMHNVSISAEARAMLLDDVYELVLDDVRLTDLSGRAPLLIRGKYTGAISVDNFPLERIEYGEGVSEDVVGDDGGLDAGQNRS